MLSWLFSLFSTSKTNARPDGMRTIPCTALDVIGRDIILTTGLIVKAKLDPKRLEQTLSKLIEIKFPRAGARLAFRNRAYEFQIPETFDTRIPPAKFTVEDRPEAYSCAGRPEIPIGLTSSRPCVTPMLGPDFDAFFRSKTCPKTLDDFLLPNVPLLHVHVVVFHDLTLIGVTWPHIGFDAVGMGTLLAAWTRMINGSGPVKMKRGWFDLGWVAQLSFIVQFIWRFIRDPEEVLHLVRIPKAFLEEEKQKIMDELKAQGSSEYVGSSDLLVAWWLKILYGHRAPTDDTPIHLHVINSLRGQPIFTNDGPLAYPYTNNAVLSIPIPPLPASAFGQEPLSSLALHVRRAIITYNADPASVHADVQWHCAGSNAFKTVYPCPPGAEYFVQTSWRAARFGTLDFSGAVVPQREDEMTPTAARVVFVHWLSSSKKTIPFRGSGVVAMEDEDVVWTGQVCGKKEWELIKQRGEIEFI
ncbi:hypothetical protein MVEN_00273200 [Mycena venus]|uniref:Uncharacterized protein n=1 Tax=Mycena venus TaxID=2733690 RepID=A0A8H6Z2S9_9AGAR|nr:hypothetical protein MVEN_00273200 [Mycena venus]